MAASRRSNVSVRALWATAGVAATVAILAVVGSAFIGGDDGDDRRETVALYILQVNQVQQGLGTALVRVNRAYAALRFAKSSASAQLAELQRAEQTMVLLRQQVEALRPPAEATELHAELERLMALQVALAREVTGLGRYVPQLSDAQRPLAEAGARLQRELAAEPTPPEQARAFDRYATALAAVADDVDRLSAPPVLEPARRSEVARLRRLADVSRRLRTALEQRRATEVTRLTKELSDASAAVGAATRADRAAVAAYRRRLRAVEQQREAVKRERDRLDRALS
jgi:hypothetical protein